MRFDLFLNVKSSADAIKFYVEELGLFQIAIDYGMSGFLLSAVADKSACLYICEGAQLSNLSPIFGISVENCNKEFERIKKISLSNGARIVPSHNGLLEVSDYPIGKSFAMEDPSSNKFILFEDFMPRLDV